MVECFLPKKIWIKTIIIVIILIPISVFLHEAGHWIIFELNGVDSWISLQKANIINPEQLTDDISFISLFGGPIVTIMLAVISYFVLRMIIMTYPFLHKLIFEL